MRRRRRQQRRRWRGWRRGRVEVWAGDEDGGCRRKKPLGAKGEGGRGQVGWRTARAVDTAAANSAFVVLLDAGVTIRTTVDGEPKVESLPVRGDEGRPPHTLDVVDERI